MKSKGQVEEQEVTRRNSRGGNARNGGTNPEAEKRSFLGESRGKETAAMKRMKKRQVLTDQVRRF